MSTFYETINFNTINHFDRKRNTNLSLDRFTVWMSVVRRALSVVFSPTAHRPSADSGSLPFGVAQGFQEPTGPQSFFGQDYADCTDQMQRSLETPLRGDANA